MFNHKKLVELLAEKQISRQTLAENIGVSQAMVSYIVNGLKEPSFPTVCRIAKLLGVKVDDLKVS